MHIYPLLIVKFWGQRLYSFPALCRIFMAGRFWGYLAYCARYFFHRSAWLEISIKFSDTYKYEPSVPNCFKSLQILTCINNKSIFFSISSANIILSFLSLELLILYINEIIFILYSINLPPSRYLYCFANLGILLYKSFRQFTDELYIGRLEYWDIIC